MSFEDHSNLQTPEGVELSVTVAGLGSRIGASIIDSSIILVILVVVLAASSLPTFSAVIEFNPVTGEPVFREGAFLYLAIFGLIVSLVLAGYHIVFESTRGQTPGKRAFGIRVTTVEGDRIGFRQAFIRNVVRIVDALPLYNLAGIVSILVSPRNQRIGDIAAKTIVVRQPRPGHVFIPPDIKQLAETAPLDIYGLSQAEIEAVRHYVSRRNQLDFMLRARFSKQLADRIRPKIPTFGSELTDDQFLMRVMAAIAND